MRKNQRPTLKEAVPLGQILSQVLKSPQTDTKIQLSHLQYCWRDLVGPTLYRRTLPVKIVGERLIIGVEGPSWANELEFIKVDLLDKIRRSLPDLPLKEIRFQLRPKSS